MSAITTMRKRPAIGQLTGTHWTTAMLGLLTLIGGAAGIYRLFVGLGPTTNLSDGIPWGIWIGFDFALIAFSGAAFTMAAVVYVLRLEKFRPAMRPAVLFGLLGYVSVLVLLVLDLGRWDRFWSFFINWNIHSPLFEISWCIVLYSTVLVFEFSPQLFERLNKQGPVKFVYRIAIGLVIIGVTLSSLHQSTLGTLYLNMPYRLDALWYSPILNLLFFISSLMAGLAVTTIVYPIAARLRSKPVDNGVVSGLARGAAWITLLYTVLKLGDMLLAGELPALFAFDRMSLLMWLELGAGAIVPMILFFIPALRKQRRWQNMGALLILFGVLMNRFDATLFAQTARPGAIYSPHILEWLSTIGVLAAAALVWRLCIKMLVIFDSPADAKYHH